MFFTSYKLKFPTLFLLAIAFFIISCTSPLKVKSNHNANQQAEALFEAFFQQKLNRSPTFQTSLGLKENNNKWDNISDAFEVETHKLNQENLKSLHRINRQVLNTSNQLNYQLLENRLSSDINHFQWRYHNYPVNQMYGWHSSIASILINQHKIETKDDAVAYIARIKAVPVLMGQLIDGLKLRESKGIILPEFIIPFVVSDSQNLLNGIPFEGKSDSVLMADFRKKVQVLALPPAEEELLLKQFSVAMKASFAPAYQSLIHYLTDLKEKSDGRAGAWKFPEGADFYNAALKRTTTTDLTAEEIHSIGLKEVIRIHNEMRALIKQVEFKGDLQQFFSFMRDDKQFYYAADKKGRDAYLATATDIIETMKASLDQYFITKPKADLVVKRVETFREQSAGKAFYQFGAKDGSRPAYYYANLFNMKEMPTYQMEALAYHEGIPGHHMQLSIAQELENVPEFRKYERYTAYTEGWGLYSELLPKEMGFYQDPYSDFGRLSMELWRACRLVTDTGLHAKRWTRNEAVEYLVSNTPFVRRDSERAIDRYIVMPSQATAYKIGMLKILELREWAKGALGDRFSIREFHEQILKAGAIPLNILESRIHAWAKAEKNSGH